LAQLFLPAVNHITQKNLSLIPGGNFLFLLAVFAFAILIGLIAGFYPAIYLSSFKPVKVLKGQLLTGIHTLSLRKVLVVTQFTISIALIVGTIVVVRQVSFVQNAKLGLDKEHIIMVNDFGFLSRSERQSLKSNILGIPGIKNVAVTDGIVGGQNWTTSLRLKGSDNSQLVNFLTVDADYLQTLNIEIKEGRRFSPQFPGDTLNFPRTNTLERPAGSVILNETAVKHLGIPEPAVGRQLVYDEDNDTTYYVQVVGVVKDFHFTSMRNEIKPFAFFTSKNRQGYLAIKLEGKNLSQTIDRIKSVWERDVESRPFQYSFLDETYSKLYRAEQNFRTIFFYITAIAIFIACLGLFGLAAFTAEQRTKEIGIRKVVGASVSNIVALLSRDFVRLVVLSIVIATPIAWLAMNKWLQGFVYRIDLNWWMFVLAGLVALLIAIITVSFQAMKAALANPVKSLRTE
jgi:putative ABC transport system permease protein